MPGDGSHSSMVQRPWDRVRRGPGRQLCRLPQAPFMIEGVDPDMPFAGDGFSPAAGDRRRLPSAVSRCSLSRPARVG